MRLLNFFQTTLPCAALAVSALPWTAVAGDLYLGPSVYFATPDSSLHAKSDVGAQFTLGYQFDRNFGLELLSENSRFKLDDGSGTLNERGASLLGTYHLVFPDHPVSPFLSLGGGWVHSSYRDRSDSVPLARGGLGLNWDIPSTSLSFKADASVRHLVGNSAVPFYASQNQTDRLYTVGMQYAFGQEAPRNAKRQEVFEQTPAYQYATPNVEAAAQEKVALLNNCTVNNKTNTCSGPADQDGDGVPDAVDKCPDTPPNAVVDADGCLLYLRKD